MKVWRQKLFPVISAFLAAIYLAYVIDCIYPSTWVERICSFVITSTVSFVCIGLQKKYLPSVCVKYIALAFALAASVFVLFQQELVPQKKQIEIEMFASGQNQNASSGEIWLCEIKIDGEEQPFSEVVKYETTGWNYNSDGDDFVFYPDGKTDENRLTLSIEASEAVLCFAQNPWSGIVDITFTDREKSIDLYAAEATWERAEFTINARDLFTTGDWILYVFLVMGYLVVCTFILLLVGKFLGIKVFKEKTGDIICNKFSIIYLANFFLLFFTSSKIAPDAFTKIFLAVFSMAAASCISSSVAQNFLKKYKTVGKTAAIAVVSLYGSLASFGQRFFLDGNTRIHFSAIGLFYVLVGAVWFIPIIYLLLLGLEWLASFRSPRLETSHRRRVFWALLGTLCVCQAVVLYAFWPGGFPPDCINQLAQAIGEIPFNDWHPILATLLFRGILAIVSDVAAITGVQLFVFVLLCVKFLMLGYDYGMSFHHLLGLGCVFILLPNQVFSGILTTKDFPYALALLWATYLLVCLIQNPERIQKISFLAELSLDMFLICGFRHNGIVSVVALLMLFVLITVRYFPIVKIRLLIASGVSILLILLYKGPLFAALDVTPNTMSPYTTMLSAVGSCVNKDLPLSEETNRTLESVIPLEQWGDYYSRYVGHDTYYWGRGDVGIANPFDPSHISRREAFSIYFEALSKYPDIVVKDRLDGMDILWDVCQPSDSFNVKSFDLIYAGYSDDVGKYISSHSLVREGDNYYNRSFLAETYRKTLYTEVNNVFDMLIWRTGAYIILFLVLGIFWWGNRMNNLFWAAVPLLGNIIGLALVLFHQSFRYVYPIQVLTVALAFCSICLKNQEYNEISRGQNTYSHQ